MPGGGRRLSPGNGIEGAGAVELLRRVPGRSQAVAFFRQDVERKHRPIGLLGKLEIFYQSHQVMPVDRAKVAQAEILE